MIRMIRNNWRGGLRSKGQILIMAAGFAVVLVGMLGLAVDLGYAFAQKRATQNSADAAAIAGTRALTKWSTTNLAVTAWPDASSVATANKLGDATQTITCAYVDDTGAQVASCNQLVPPTATGVTVTVSETHPTFFMRAIPGAPKTVTTRASATAHAQAVEPNGSGGPFIMCGSSAKLLSGGSMPIVIDTSGKYSINPAAIGQTFVVHGPQIDDCGIASNRFKGLAEEDNNAGKTLPDWFMGYEGVKAGPANQLVAGVQGCQANTEDPFNCVMFVPLATDNPMPKKVGSDNFFYIVAYAAFQVSDCKSPCQHQATLINDYIIQAPDGLPSWTPGSWTRGAGGIIAIRLSK